MRVRDNARLRDTDELLCQKFHCEGCCKDFKLADVYFLVKSRRFKKGPTLFCLTSKTCLISKSFLLPKAYEFYNTPYWASLLARSWNDCSDLLDSRSKIVLLISRGPILISNDPHEKRCHALDRPSVMIFFILTSTFWSQNE